MRRVLRLVGRHVVDEVPLSRGRSQAGGTLSVGDHPHEVFWIDGDLWAGNTCMMTMHPC